MRKLLRAILSILVCILVIPTAYAQVLSTNWQVVADIDDAVSFSVAADGTIAFIKSDGASFIKFASGEAIQTINADLTAIEVIDRNSFWGITTGNQLVKFDNGNWQQYLSNVSHIDLSNNGNLGVVRDSGDTEIYNAQMQLLDVLVGKVSKVFVSEQARHWAIDGASNTSRLIPNQWLGVDGKAMDINISANQRTLMVGLDEQIYEWDAEQTNWQLFASNAPSKQIEISEQDEFWRLGSDGLLYFLGDRDINDGINTSEPNGDGGSQGPQDPELILNFDFSAVNQAAQDIIIGPDGRVIAKLSEFSFALWSNRTRSFQQIAGRISDVNIDSLGNVFAISEGRKLLSLSESGWNEEPLDGFYTEIESGPNNGLLLLAPDLSLFRLDRASLAPIKLFDNVVEFAFSQQANELWYLDNQQNIFKCTQLLSCQRVAGQALDISLGQNGQVFIVDTNFLLKVYSADQQNFVQTNKANVLKVATGPNEMPWVLTNQGQIERTTLFERDEGDDLRILELARRTQDETQSSLSLTGTLFEVSNSLLYVPSVDACQAVIGEFSVGLTSQNSFAIEDLSLRGSAQRFLSLQASSFNNVTKQQTIEILINCEALPTLNNNAYFADISLNLVDEVSQLNVQAQRRFNVDISVLSLQSNTLGLSQSHNVGLSQCPQSFQSIEITSSDQAFFSLRDVRLSEELSEIMVISANLASSALSHSIESSFNCADLTPGIYRGEIIVDAVQSDSGAISQKVFPVELEVFIEPIEVSLSAQSLFLSHSVGFSSCPNDFEVVTASITENRAFRFESLEVTGSIAPVVNVLNSGNTAASQQEIQIQFNCAQLRVANYSGQLTAIAISEISGATQEVSINLSLEVVIDPIDILLSSNAISLTHSVGVSSCPQSFEVVTASTADNQAFVLENVAINGNIQGLVDVTVTPNSADTQQAIEAQFNCEASTAGNYTGTITATAVNLASGATQEISISVSVNVVIEPIDILLSSNAISLTHSVGVSSCPQDFEVVTASTADNQAFVLENVAINGNIQGLVDVTVTPNSADTQQAIEAQFNCEASTAGNYTGTITATAVNLASGATQEISISVSVNVVIEPIDILLSSNAISLTHSVGVSSCPQDFEVVTASTADNQAFVLENVSINGDIQGLVDVTVTPNSADTQQAIEAQFNCEASTAGNYTGTITATAVNLASGATQEISISVSVNIVIEPIQVFLSRSSISLTHDVGLSNCPNDFDPVSVSITDNQAFTIENVSINGSLSSLIDVDISPATSSEAKSIQARFNCLSFSAGSFSGTITATAINDVSGATQTFSINVSLEVSEQELPINLSTSSISLTHTVGESSCPDDYDLVIAESALDEDFTIKDIQVSGDVASRIDVDVTPNTPNFTQTIAVSFNCSNTIVGNFSGTLTMTAEDVATGREKQLSLQINLSVNSVPFNITLSNSSLIDEHVVGTDACPQLIGDVEINSTSSKDFIISGLSVSDSSVANVIEAQTLSNSPSTSQTVRVEFNCDDATNNVYRGTVSGNAEHPSTGESISFEIDIEFEVSTPPIDYLIDPNPVQNIYTVGSSNCPSRLTEVVLQHNNNEDLLLAEVQMIGTLSSDINLSFEPSLGSEDSLHIIYVTFNCNDLTPGIRTGTITGEVEEFDTGIFETFTVDVTLEVVDGVRLRLGVVESSLGSGSSLPSQAVNNELLDFSAQETKPEVIPELVTQNSEGTQTSRPNGLIRKLPNDEPALTPRKTRSGTLLSTELASEELAELKEVLQNANVEPTLEAAPNDGSPIQNNEATETNNELPLIEENSTQSGFVVQRVEQNRSINISDQANQRQNLRAQKLQADRLSAEKLESRRLQANSLSTKNISADSLFDSQNQSLQIIEDRQNALQQKFQEREARAAQFQQDRINNWLKRNRLQRIESTQKETNASEAQTQQSQGADDDK